MPEHEFLAPSMASSGSSSIPPEPPSQRMTNEDFRKLMMTPRGGSGSSSSSGGGGSGGGGGGGSGSSGTLGSAAMTQRSGGAASTPQRKADSAEAERAEKRKKKKSFYAKLKKQEDDKTAELAAKYRDRARERRDGQVLPDGAVSAGGGGGGGAQEEAASSASTSGYRAVAPDVKSSYDAAERRRQMIQESKFLGGDMEHTHLVKGLDFALLQKVRSEITTRENHGSDDEFDEKEEAAREEQEKSEAAKRQAKKEAEEEVKEKEVDPIIELQAQCRTAMARNVVRSVFKTPLPKVNELFFPGRMAYVIDLEEEFAESDIPTTTIRSKADVEGTVTHQATLSTNDIVINKLTQILSYLRAGSRSKKKKKDKHPQGSKQEDEALREKQKTALANLPIYDDVDGYDPRESSSRRDRRDERGRRDHRGDRRDGDDRRHDEHGSSRRRGGERWDNGGGGSGSSSSNNRRGGGGGDQQRDKRGPYFESREDEGNSRKEDHDGGLTSQDKEYIRKLAEREKQKDKRAVAAGKGGLGLATAEPEGYAECYPGLQEMNDAIDDSDDEVDYSKMDLGNKKGPVGRWDFDTPDEYAEYMSKKEALPKAAFQYGVKMAEGRKTRGKVGVKSEKAKLDREWNKISALIDKRKSGGGGGGGGQSKRAKQDE